MKTIRCGHRMAYELDEIDLIAAVRTHLRSLEIAVDTAACDISVDLIVERNQNNEMIITATGLVSKRVPA